MVTVSSSDSWWVTPLEMSSHTEGLVQPGIPTKSGQLGCKQYHAFVSSDPHGRPSSSSGQRPPQAAAVGIP